MANGDTPWTWADHDRWVREVFIPHVQEDQLHHHEMEGKAEKLEALIMKAIVGVGSLLFATLGAGIANLIVALANSAHHP